MQLDKIFWIFRGLLVALLVIYADFWANAQCNPFLQQALSRRPANYEIHAKLDDQTKMVTATQTIRFQNQSPVPITRLCFYMYFNSFKNTESSFLKGAANIFGQSYTDRKQSEWGWIDVSHIDRVGGADLSASMRYIQADDGNVNDQSVLEVTLDQPLAPNDTAVFHLVWKAQVPKTIARAGYSRDFYLFCHWFPQLGVFEENKQGVWDWNCHQFFRTTEFYADFGVYDVFVNTDAKFVLGASGCLVEEKLETDGTLTRHYHAEDVIDFAWSIYPLFEVHEEQWRGVHIRLLLPKEHAALGPRYLKALKFALEYLDEHVGRYPYPSITVVDPPFHGLRSGLMEYPTLITVGTFYGIPSNIRITESLVVHEFVHQYFMGMVASNEKEEAWLDEGFVTYFEDRIIDAAYGAKHSLVDLFGYQFDNKEQTRVEYTAMANPRSGIVARPGWEFNDSNFKALIYSKTATTLRTVEQLVGTLEMDRIIKAYFEKWKFAHPKGKDFMAVLRKELAVSQNSTDAQLIGNLFETSIYQAVVLDYAVTSITNSNLPPTQGIYGSNAENLSYKDGSDTRKPYSRVQVQRLGEWIFPVDVLIHFEDGNQKTVSWSGQEAVKVFEFFDSPKIVSAIIDPEHKLSLDVDLNNNSINLAPEKSPIWKYTVKAIFWIQNMMQTLTLFS